MLALSTKFCCFWKSVNIGTRPLPAQHQQMNLTSCSHQNSRYIYQNYNLTTAFASAQNPCGAVTKTYFQSFIGQQKISL